MKRAKIEYEYLSIDDFERLIKNMTGSWEKYAVALTLVRFRGIPPCDVVKLRLQDITRDYKIRYVRSKTGHTQTIKLPPVCRLRLKSYVEKNKHMFMHGYLFPSYFKSKTGHLTTDALRRIFRKFLKLEGFELNYIIDNNKGLPNAGRKLCLLRLYDLRSSFGTDVFKATGSLYKTMIAMWHADIRPTLAYMRKSELVNEENMLSEVFSCVTQPDQSSLFDFDSSCLTLQMGWRKEKKLMPIGKKESSLFDFEENKQREQEAFALIQR